MSCKCLKEIPLKFKRLSPNAQLPKYETEGAAGFDLSASEFLHIYPGDTKVVKTGWAVEVPPGYELQIRPRSGISLNTPLLIKNAPGTIDSDYRGEVGVIVHNLADPSVTGNRPVFIEVGMRIAQGVLKRVERAAIVSVGELSTTERGDGGYGHTGV
jgi:dUTP pyrophosphatase